MSNVNVINEWLETARLLNELKAKELELRNKITPLVLGDKKEGSKTAIVDGFKLTAQARLNYSLDKAMVAEIWDDLSQDELACLEWVLELKVPAYRKLEGKTLLQKAVTVKPGQAQLSVKN